MSNNSKPETNGNGDVSMMFTDIVGSSPIKRLLGTTEAQQDQTWVERFQERHHEIVRFCCAENDGEEIKTIGDAFFVVFRDPANAVRCAVAIQRGLDDARLVTPLPGNPPLQVRIGLHESRPVRQGRDYVGTSVDLAARIEGAAAGGQILVSQRIRDRAVERVPDLHFYEQGEFPLKGMGVHTLHEVLWDGRPPCRTGQQELRNYLAREKEHLLGDRAAGFRNLFVRDTVASDLYISPPWKDAAGKLRTDDLCEHVVARLANPATRRILILGNPGQGKSTLLKRAFMVLADRFLAGDSSLLPICLPLRNCGDAMSEEFGTREWLWKLLRNDSATPIPLDFEQFSSFLASERVVLLLDGFDEIGLSSQASAIQAARRPIFNLPAVLTCRVNYFDLYLRMSPVDERFAEQLQLTPWEFASAGRRYIDAFARFRKSESSDAILGAILAQESALELADRPLLLTMMLELLTSTHEHDAVRDASSLSALYESYTENWLSYESARTGSRLSADEKAALLQSVAWSLYVTRRADLEAYGDWRSSTVCTRRELREFIEQSPEHYEGRSLNEAVEDVRLRSFLAEERRDHIAFLHLSFQEFYVARHIFQRISACAEGVAEVFRELIPLPVGLFLLDLLVPGRCAAHRRERISDNLIAASERARGEDDAAVHVREHAVFYLSTLRTEKGRKFLEREFAGEKNKVIQRSMMVGLGLFWKRRDVIDEYVQTLIDDAAAAEVNLGYHFVYFGDQPREEGYRDAGRACHRTVRSIVRHLKDPDTYGSIRPLDLHTLRSILERRGAEHLAVADQDFVREFLAQPRVDHGETFERERLALRGLLNGRSP